MKLSLSPWLARYLVAALFACLPMSLLAQSPAEAAQEFTLANGMKIVVKEDRRAPTVAHMVWYRAGSIDEHSGATGVAHVLEHMMFKGTKSLKPGEFSQRVAALGGRENAFTSKDYTAYFQQIEKSRLDEVMALEADRMANLVLDADEFAKEIRVVMEERRWRTDDQPVSLVYEALDAATYVAHPYRNPIVGWMSDLQSMTVDDARAWYERWYAPNNAVLVVIGDVEADKVRALAEKHFGPHPRRDIVPTKPQTEPVQRGIRRVTVKAPAENPYLVMVFKTPALRDLDQDVDAYALDVLAGVLSGYDNARLNARLVRSERIANSVSAGYSGISRGPAVFMLDGRPADGTSVAVLEQRLRAEIDRIAKEGISERELTRVKAQLIAAQVYKRDSIFGQAMEIGMMEMSGFSHRDIDRITDKLRAVSKEQVQAVAGRYFGDDQLTVADLVPLPIEEKTPAAPPASLRH